MNEQELERRFRSVTDGTQPNAPQSLRHFLYTMPETVPARPESPIRRLTRFLSLPAAPRLAGAGLIAAVVVAALFGANFVMGIRSNVPASSSSTTPQPTAVRSFRTGEIVWLGTSEVSGPVPFVAVSGGPLGYMGVGRSASGRNVLLDSQDGLSWIQRATADAPAIELNSIAHMPGAGYVLVGGTQGAEIYFSPDGVAWTAAKVESPLVPVQAVAANKLGFVAVGSSAGAGTPTYVWFSTDGTTWTGGNYGISLTGAAWLRAESDRFFVGAAYVGGHSGMMYLPVAEIRQLTNPAAEALKMLPAAKDGLGDVTILGGVAADPGSLNFYGEPREAFLARGSGQVATELLLPTEWNSEAMSWTGWAEIQPRIAGTNDLQNDLQAIEMVGRFIVGADSHGSVYTSDDLGLTWTHVPLDAVSRGPGGTRIVALGDGKVLVTGEQQGVWLAWSSD